MNLALTLFVCVLQGICGQETTTDPVTTGGENITSLGVQPSIKLGYALLLILGFGVFSVVVAIAFNLVRKKVYHDSDNVDTAFDAGGNVSIGLTATTIVSQWTWSATLLQSSTVASKYGISGPFWYGAGATIQILMFATLSIQLKTKAPGAKTFLQVIRARFGKSAHIVFCVFACVTNLVVMVSLLLAGTSVMTSLVEGLSLELACLIMAAVMGSYTLIGGLGATFYVSYFNTSLIFSMIILLVIEVYYNPSGRASNPLGSPDVIYHYLNQTRGPDGNAENSYLTFLSSGGAMFGVINIIGNFGTVFCDQSYWQSSVAAKPVQGVWGFIAGGLTWFAIPFTLATTMGLSYLALGTLRGAPLLSPADVDKGLVPPVVAQVLLQESGEYVLLLLILMAVMSTGSAEVIAVASIIVYDIYQIYGLPFRRNFKDGNCILCNKTLRKMDAEQQPYYNGKVDTSTTELFTMQKDVCVEDIEKDMCVCPSAYGCPDCAADRARRQEFSDTITEEPYHCPTHGKYRQYQDSLMRIKSWIILWFTMFTIPLILFVVGVGLNLTWVFLFTGVLIGCTVIPIALSVIWSRVTSVAMIAGVISGCVSGLTAWLIMASTYEGGLGDFLKNTGRELVMFVGNCCSIGVGGIVCIVVSLVTGKSKSDKAYEEWEKTRNIENPLHPWSLKYAEEFGIDTSTTTIWRPTQEEMAKIFRKARLIAIIVGLVLTVGLVIIWPSSMMSLVVLSETQFRMWTQFSQVWAFTAAVFIVTVPFVQEIYGIIKQVKQNRENAQESSNGEDAHTVKSNGAYVHDQEQAIRKRSEQVEHHTAL
ncbi:unnamed protein product [Owenia fusiformis]|uniref:Urea-proton symporter DUR3 n=1 Tax=Owenia fusiformis TaxID=6347 RepID=A0A8S4NPL0_OWEFU|nr:unnamed protein product [Owenia fusiformis]